jgi:hypothetical protein
MSFKCVAFIIHTPNKFFRIYVLINGTLKKKNHFSQPICLVRFHDLQALEEI